MPQGVDSKYRESVDFESDIAGFDQEKRPLSLFQISQHNSSYVELWQKNTVDSVKILSWICRL